MSEGRKKNRKLAKKNVQWKSRVPKDPGIPGNMPFKDQILAEVAEERRRVSSSFFRLLALRSAFVGGLRASEDCADDLGFELWFGSE